MNGETYCSSVRPFHLYSLGYRCISERGSYSDIRHNGTPPASTPGTGLLYSNIIIILLLRIYLLNLHST